MNKSYKVVYEIQVDANGPLEAAKCVHNLLKDGHSFNPQFYIQEEDSTDLFSVDLEEEDEDAVLPVQYYHPLIESK